MADMKEMEVDKRERKRRVGCRGVERDVYSLLWFDTMSTLLVCVVEDMASGEACGPGGLVVPVNMAATMNIQGSSRSGTALMPGLRAAFDELSPSPVFTRCVSFAGGR